MRRDGAAMLVLLLGCGGVEVRRDLSGVSPGRVGFDDMCGLQATFDAIETGYTAPPRLVFAVDLAGGRTAGGRARWAFETTSQRQVVRRVLTENWSRLPEPLAAAKQIEIEIAWTERAGIERVVTDRDSTLIVDGRSTRLPYHPCLSELLYGAPLYRRRREVLGLPLELPPPPPPPPSPPPASAPVVRPSPPVPTPQPTPAAVPAPGFRPAPTASPSTGVPAATPSPSPAPTFKPAPPSQPPP